MQPTQNFDPTVLKSGHHRRLLAFLVVSAIVGISLAMWLLNASQQVRVRISVPPGAVVEMNGKAVSVCGALKSDCDAAKTRAESHPTLYEWRANTNGANRLVVTVDGESVERAFRTEVSDVSFTIVQERGALSVREGLR